MNIWAIHAHRIQKTISRKSLQVLMTEESFYVREPISQPLDRFTKAEKLELLMWHPLFTGKCPCCGQKLAESIAECECGWKDELETKP